MQTNPAVEQNKNIKWSESSWNQSCIGKEKVYDFYFVLSRSTRSTDRQTDGRTDRLLITRPRLHSMQRGKKLMSLVTKRLVDHYYCSISYDSTR